jgi:hypothetical protein
MMVDEGGVPNGTLKYRLDRIEEELKEQGRAVDLIPVLREQVTALAASLNESRRENRSLRTIFIGFAVTVASSAVGFAITVLAVFQ